LRKLYSFRPSLNVDFETNLSLCAVLRSTCLWCGSDSVLNAPYEVGISISSSRITEPPSSFPLTTSCNSVCRRNQLRKRAVLSHVNRSLSPGAHSFHFADSSHEARYGDLLISLAFLQPSRASRPRDTSSSPIQQLPSLWSCPAKPPVCHLRPPQRRRRQGLHTQPQNPCGILPNTRSASLCVLRSVFPSHPRRCSTPAKSQPAPANPRRH